MAVPTIIGVATWPIRISDVISDITDPGSWAWYIKGQIQEVWDMTPIVDIETGFGETLGVMWGQFRWTMVIKDVVIKTKARFDYLKRAVREWNDEDDLLYFDNDIGGVDQGYWAVKDPWDAVTDKILVKIHKIVWISQNEDARVCNVYLKRYKAPVV